MRTLLLTLPLLVSACAETPDKPSTCAERRAALHEARDALARAQQAAASSQDDGAVEEAARGYQEALDAARGCQ